MPRKVTLAIHPTAFLIIIVTGLLCSSRTCYQDPQDPQDTGWELRLAPSFIPVDRFPLFS